MTNDSYSIWMYGSRARGDWDSKSDFDLFIAIDSLERVKDVCFRNGIAENRCSISAYSWDEIEKMSSYGSLFLHHLKLEGKRIVDSPAGRLRLEALLSNLCPYQNAARDVVGFKTAIADVRQSINTGWLLNYELSVVATILRHASILGCYIAGQPQFGRLSPVHWLAKEWNLNDGVLNKFSELYMFRLAADGREQCPPVASQEYLEKWCRFLERFLNKLEIKVDAYNRTLPTLSPSGAGCS
jgi:predicted nucleotidyltransferase